ncbi:hypothetical protein M0657_001808 [Pyricularia oryzae]|uniref:Uncharacterized protein n=3 Tax=Pyricularia oryzae TaxID=318829 RepID=A0A4P7NQ22_PYROR|nr:hypothetical protein OOU_Y34scaffold00540g44 [Pyricularia oryzae Y34]KAI7929157.1 hypothetical protein M9X92_001351 [Pyricularia oryzae]KAI7930003.1 hypothetical protein M0657_001808 [Pyricularia oryzae]QBZ64485.1 hypothetical protein PoMZ_06183 [Pyricularia oryzae]
MDGNAGLLPPYRAARPVKDLLRLFLHTTWGSRLPALPNPDAISENESASSCMVLMYM